MQLPLFPIILDENSYEATGLYSSLPEGLNHLGCWSQAVVETWFMQKALESPQHLRSESGFYPALPLTVTSKKATLHLWTLIFSALKSVPCPLKLWESSGMFRISESIIKQRSIMFCSDWRSKNILWREIFKCKKY